MPEAPGGAAPAEDVRSLLCPHRSLKHRLPVAEVRVGSVARPGERVRVRVRRRGVRVRSGLGLGLGLEACRVRISFRVSFYRVRVRARATQS